MPRRAPIAVPLLLLALAGPPAGRSADTLPASLSDRDFWSLVQRVSEPDGYFVSRSGSPDNLLSNEIQVSAVAAALARRLPPGGVYLGVGPEQNFTYIASAAPRIAFITDIRRGNLDLLLVYKALFELSDSRAEFVSRLFSRPLATALPRTATAAQLMGAYRGAAPVPENTFAANLNAIFDLLSTKHAFALTPDDRANMEHAYRAFYQFGPAVDYTSSINRRGIRFVTYADLMSSVDDSGHERSFLSSEERFGLVKTMERRNLVVPAVGDFAGPKALRAIGAWVRSHGAAIGAFYVSNVEQYLQRNGKWPAFCANVSALPLDRDSIFIRPNRFGSPFSPMQAETAACAGK